MSVSKKLEGKHIVSESKFLRWRAPMQDGFCVLLAPEGIQKSYQLNEGVSRAATWASDVICRMDPDFPNDIQLADNVSGTELAIVSTRIKEAIVEENAGNVEFLPIVIHNHKGRIASTEYHVMNPLDVVDCIDITKSGVRWSRIDPTLISSCRSLIIKSEGVPETISIFRPKSLPMEILLRKTLVDKLSNRGFTGLLFKDPVEFTGVG